MQFQNNNLQKAKVDYFFKNYIEIKGGKTLQGHLKISGAKNSALVLMAASILSKGEVNLYNVPKISDVAILSKLLIAMGMKIKSNANELEIITKDIIHPPQDLFFDLYHALRVSFFCIGPILARFGKAKIPLPGGCSIGARPIDEHINSLKKLGVIFKFKDNYITAEVITPNKRLIGSSINFKCKSVGATETLLMAAALAKGVTILNNAAQEPEIIDLANMLNTMGAKIKGAGSECITIEGVESLQGCNYSVMPDRIEAGTFLIAAAITRSTISLSPVEPKHLTAVINKLKMCGCRFEYSNHVLRIIPKRILDSVNITTSPYPGFPTDLQAPFMALMTTANGISKIKETVFENRMHHVKELNHMGANINVKNNIATVVGVKKLQGSIVLGSDLRASAALALAGLSADGKTLIQGLEHLERGYENFSTKLEGLGASIANKKKIKIMFKMKHYFSKSSIKSHLTEYKSAFTISFIIGALIATIPYMYKLIYSYKNQQLIHEQRKIEIENKEKMCKDSNSDYIKFFNLGFPDTATKKFNICIKEK